MKTKTLTFAHPTYQTGHNTVHTDYTPPQAVINALIHIGPKGDFPVRDWIIRVAPYAPNVATFTILREGIAFVKCYASYITAPDRAEATYQQIMGELHADAAGLKVAPVLGGGLTKIPPMRVPFVMVAFLPDIWYAGLDLPVLGDAERCIYWHLHQFYGE